MTKHSKRGETLTETLAAVLVTGLATALLASMINASYRMDKKASTANAELTTAMNAAEAEASTDAAATLVITIDGDSSETVTATVYVFGDDDASSYSATEPSATTAPNEDGADGEGGE